MQALSVGRICAGLLLFVMAQLAPTEVAQAAYQATASTNLNYRAGPGTNYQVVGTIPQGGLVTVYQCSESYNWCDIDYAGSRGWASSKYLTYAGSGTYYGRPLLSTGVYIGLPLIRYNYPIYGLRPPHYRPPNYRPPGNRPPGFRPPGNRPPGYRPPGHRPPGFRPPGNRPPGFRPPGHRPPGFRPPGNRPPGARPQRPNRPTVRPTRPSRPSARPPNFRPRPGARPGGGHRGGHKGKGRGR
ncbi:SH3 domain-containing protein [Roseibium sp.]|uniref:SH3 domain-containing protein n=1 Tax=Roseibium sp. TaxID=1936156 RepID=UPI003D1322B2